MSQTQKNPGRPARRVTPGAQSPDFQLHEYPFPRDNDPGSEEVHERLVLPYGVMETTRWHLDGIRLLHVRYHYHGHYFFGKENADDLVNLSFNLKGAYHIRHLGETYPVVPLQHNMIYSPGTSNTFFNDELEAETFTIQFTPEAFVRLTGSPDGMLGHFSSHVINGSPSVLARDSLLLDARLQKAIYDVRSSRFAGQMKRIFLLSKSMEILLMQTDAFVSRAAGQAEAPTTPTDHERVRYAAEYLISRVTDPPNLSELARKAGLNEYKLKRGFREVFGMSVFGYLATHRLMHARQMLLDTDKTAAEIAFEMGFSSPQHFNNAFKKHFGIPPGRFLRGGPESVGG